MNATTKPTPLVYLGTSGVRYLTEKELEAWYGVVHAVWCKRVPAKAQKIMSDSINSQTDDEASA